MLLAPPSGSSAPAVHAGADLNKETVMKRLHAWLAAMALFATSGIAFAQGKEVKIAHVYVKTGPLEAYAKQTQAGFMPGLEYATGGKMEVAGKKLVVVERDSQ